MKHSVVRVSDHRLLLTNLSWSTLYSFFYSSSASWSVIFSVPIFKFDSYVHKITHSLSVSSIEKVTASRLLHSQITPKFIFIPRSAIYLAAFAILTLKHLGWRANFARRQDSFDDDIICISRFEVLIVIIELTAFSLSSWFSLRDLAISETLPFFLVNFAMFCPAERNAVHLTGHR